MQLDYKDIIIKHYALSMSGSEIARQAGMGLYQDQEVEMRTSSYLIMKRMPSLWRHEKT